MLIAFGLATVLHLSVHPSLAESGKLLLPENRGVL